MVIFCSNTAFQFFSLSLSSYFSLLMEALLSKVAPYAAILVTCQIHPLLRGSGVRKWLKTSGILNEILQGNEARFSLPLSVVSCSDLISCQSKMKKRGSETAPGKGVVQGREYGSEGRGVHSLEGREHVRATPALIPRVPHQPSGQCSVCMNSHSPWSLPVKECTLNMAGTLRFPQECECDHGSGWIQLVGKSLSLTHFSVLRPGALWDLEYWHPLGPQILP